MTNKLSIMLIDDNEVDLYLHEKYLRLNQIASNTSAFGNVDEALSYLQDNDDKPFPDVILLDIQMPALDGFDFIYKFKKFPLKLRQNTNIIMVTIELLLIFILFH